LGIGGPSIRVTTQLQPKKEIPASLGQGAVVEARPQHFDRNRNGGCKRLADHNATGLADTAGPHRIKPRDLGDGWFNDCDSKQ
jgi:hypothetical protein